MVTQSRFWVSTHRDYEEAQKAKKQVLTDNPGETYQVRKGRDKTGIVFRLVQRFKINQATTIINEKNKAKRDKRNAKRLLRTRV